MKQWQIPLNRCIYTAFSYMTFLLYIILYVAEVQPPVIHWVDICTAVWIISYTFRDIGTGKVCIIRQKALSVKASYKMLLLNQMLPIFFL